MIVIELIIILNVCLSLFRSSSFLELSVYNYYLQGTPTKGETPGKVTKKAEDKENIYSASEENVEGPSSLVNETFKLEKDSLTFRDLSEQHRVEMAREVETGADKYSCIAILDEEGEDEKWEERTSVITSTDHQEYVAAAGAIIHELLNEIQTPEIR